MAYEGQSKITEPYLITFWFGIVDKNVIIFYKYHMSSMFLTLTNYHSEASIMVARQLKIVTQIDAFTI